MSLFSVYKYFIYAFEIHTNKTFFFTFPWLYFLISAALRNKLTSTLNILWKLQVKTEIIMKEKLNKAICKGKDNSETDDVHKKVSGTWQNSGNIYLQYQNPYWSV